MPIDCKCAACGAGFRAKDEQAGKQLKCPKCAGAVAVPAPSAPAEDNPFAFDELDRPRPKAQAPPPPPVEKPAPVEKPKLAKTPGTCAPCPHCGAQDAKKVKWTWWGSWYGPALFHSVRCLECGGGFNGKTGGTNLVPMLLFVTIPAVLIVVVLVVIWFSLKQKGLL